MRSILGENVQLVGPTKPQIFSEKVQRLPEFDYFRISLVLGIQPAGFESSVKVAEVRVFDPQNMVQKLQRLRMLDQKM